LAGFGQLRPFGVAAKITGGRTFASHRTSRGEGFLALPPGLCSRRQRDGALQDAHGHALQHRIVIQEIAQSLG
jgi:hypothetical protein